MNRKISLVLASLLLATIPLTAIEDDNVKRDKIEQALQDAASQVRDPNTGMPPESWNEENADIADMNQPTYGNPQHEMALGQNNSYQTQTPVVNEVRSNSSNRPKKDYSNLPVPAGAKLLTLRTELSIPITKEKHTIIEFPFEIKAEFGEFEAKATQEEAETLEVDKQRQPVSIIQKENRLVINSSLNGKAEAIIWGSPYPVVLNITIGNSKNNPGYYVIKEQDSYARQGSNVKKLENNNHEKVISILTAAMYKDKKPKGYEKKDKKKICKYKELGLTLVHVYSLEGDHYVGERWEVKNEDKKKTLNLYEEMFYVPDVYSVSFLANPIGPKKSTSMYIVRKKPDGKKGR